MATLSQILARFRSFSSPRASLFLLLLGLGVGAFGRRSVTAGGPERLAALSALDSAIVAATPTTDDTTAATSARLVALVSQKRDLESAVNQKVQRFMYWSIGSSLLILAAIITGGLALLQHLADGTPDPVSPSR